MNMKVFLALLVVGMLGGSGAGYLVLQQRDVAPPAISQGETNSTAQGSSGGEGNSANDNNTSTNPAELFRATTSIKRLKVGDCIGGEWGNSLTNSETVPCTEQHSAEIISMYNIVGKYKAGEEFQNTMTLVCNGDVPKYLAKVSEKAPLRLTATANQADDKSDPTAFACLLGEVNGSKRSLKGASL